MKTAGNVTATAKAAVQGKPIFTGEDEDSEQPVFIPEDTPLWHGHIQLEIINMRGLPKTELIFGTCDPYVTVHLGPMKLFRTETKHTRNPDYDYKWQDFVCGKADKLIFKIKDLDVDGSQHIGDFEIAASLALKGERLQGSYPITIKPRWAKAGKKPRMRIDFKFTPASDAYNALVRPDFDLAYFDSRGGSRVTLFHDAMLQEEHKKHQIMLANGELYKDQACWEMMFDYIMNAKKFIYIIGWSVWTELKMKRDQDCPTLGEMLKKKADEGVQVLIMVWDELLSTTSRITGKTSTGLMGTHDEDTYLYFKDYPNIGCIKVPRQGVDKGKNLWKRFLERNAMSYLYTHHQKTVVLDAPALNDPSKRRLVGFVGGLDLTNGRYDTPNHNLFRGLGTTWYQADFHQPNIADGSVTYPAGPREPWHDIHAFVEGPAARDLYRNFTERWDRQGSRGMRFLHDAHNYLDITEVCIPELEDRVCEKGSQEEFRAQILRSIDSFAADFDFSTANLVKTIGRKVDPSIRWSYVHNIRRAKNFIYIENQYFIGSSHMWEQAIGASDNIVPAEIAVKICDKIRAGEDFAAYVVVPMWPEGIPTDVAIQEILAFQYSTMEMMYKMIGKAIEDKGLTGVNPKRYLNFFCLGARESMEGANTDVQVDQKKIAGLLQKTRRFMIYVHSKMMVTDDEFAIVGSANINTRSMAGTRDTEIAVGTYQPKYMATVGETPKGQVHGFRMSCWAEHLGIVEDVFTRPQTKECVDRVAEIAAKNWQDYLQEEPVDMHAHLLPYPILVEDSGDVKPLPGFELFADTQAKVMGQRSNAIPDALTT